MFNNFLIALVQKIVTHLQENSGLKNLDKLSVPEAFQDYLKDVSDEQFIKDMKLVSNFIQAAKTTEIKNNAFFKALVQFLASDLGRKIDYLDGNFYLLSKDKRQETIEQLIKGESQVAQELRQVLINFSYQQIAAEVHFIANKVQATPYVLVQAPREIDIELKKEIRKKLSEKFPTSMATFQINRKLIGGIRIFQDGETIDHSWISRVLRFTSLTAN